MKDFLIITNYWLNSSGGGVTEYTNTLVNSLKKHKNWKTRVVFREGKDSSNFHYSNNKLLFVIQTFYFLIWKKPQNILTQGGWFSLLPAYIYKKMYPRVKVAYLYHTRPMISSVYKKNHKINIFFHFILQKIYNRIDFCCFVSKKLLEEVEKIHRFQFKKDKIKILYSGIDTTKVEDTNVEKFREKYLKKGSFPVLLGLGLTVLPYKAAGAKLLIESLSLLKSKYPNIRLVLTRDGKYKKYLEKYAQSLGLEQNVIFTGFVKDQLEAIRACDIYTHISFGEGLPISIYESMSQGKVIVATRVGGIPEIITNEENGILVSYSANSIADGIKKVLDNASLYDKLEKNSLQTIQSSYSTKILSGNIYKLFN